MAFRSASTAGGQTNATPDPGKPSGTASDDILLMAVCSLADIQGPTGWTQIESNIAVNGMTALWWALGSVASTQFTNVGNTTVDMVCAAFSGRNTASPITASAKDTANSGQYTTRAPSVTAVALDDSVCVWGVANNSANPPFITIPGGYVEAANSHSANGVSICYKEAVSAGATGDQDAERDHSAGYQNNGGIQVALAVAASGPAVPVFVHHRKMQGVA